MASLWLCSSLRWIQHILEAYQAFNVTRFAFVLFPLFDQYSFYKRPKSKKLKFHLKKYSVFKLKHCVNFLDQFLDLFGSFIYYRLEFQHDSESKFYWITWPILKNIFMFESELFHHFILISNFSFISISDWLSELFSHEACKHISPEAKGGLGFFWNPPPPSSVYA
jgi:hypothetical protein